MNARVKKVILALLTGALLFGSGRLELSLNRDREQLGLTHTDVLNNAPPVLAFTTVALGGFRGLISNFLWIRANNLQEDDKFFEAAQLADWITDLEPHFTQVWLFQAWNMTYNISIKFKDFSDRWRWVERGMELLRDQGLRWNPNNLLMYRELAWFFQHKMGQNLDDANLYFKSEWAREMTPFFGPNGTNFSQLLDPQTSQERTNLMILREKYKFDPAFAKSLDDKYGPLDWRLPEAHAIYWGARALEQAQKHPDKVNKSDLLADRRVVYQSMLQAFHHGRIISNPFTEVPAYAPNLDLIPKVNDAYEEMMHEDTNSLASIAIAHRNFLTEAIYYLYVNNRLGEAAKWYRILGEDYPDKPILENDTNSYPRNLTLDEFVVARTEADVKETSQDIVMQIVQGYLVRAYDSLAIGQDDNFVGYRLLAQKIYDDFQNKVSQWAGNKERVGLPPWETINRAVLNDLLDPQNGIPYAARAVLRTQLRMPPETTNSDSTFAIPTNTVAPPIGTNSVMTNSTSP